MALFNVNSDVDVDVNADVCVDVNADIHADVHVGVNAERKTLSVIFKKSILKKFKNMKPAHEGT